jgi:hypothetical protein
VAWTAATLKARFAEFGPTPDAVVTACLVAAANQVDPRLFGDDTDEAVGWLAAHKLASSPHGVQARLEKTSPETVYLAEWRRIARTRAGGPHLAPRGYT